MGGTLQSDRGTPHLLPAQSEQNDCAVSLTQKYTAQVRRVSVSHMCNRLSDYHTKFPQGKEGEMQVMRGCCRGTLAIGAIQTSTYPIHDAVTHCLHLCASTLLLKLHQMAASKMTIKH